MFVDSFFFSFFLCYDSWTDVFEDYDFYIASFGQTAEGSYGLPYSLDFMCKDYFLFSSRTQVEKLFLTIVQQQDVY